LSLHGGQRLDRDRPPRFWRPLAASQDELALDGLRFLRSWREAVAARKQQGDSVTTPQWAAGCDINAIVKQ